jgi:hypothetical protein
MSRIPRRLVPVLLLLALAAASFVYYRSTQSGRITKLNLQRVKEGMTLRQVQDLLGPPRAEVDPLAEFERYTNPKYFTNEGKPGLFFGRFRAWYSKEGGAEVFFTNEEGTEQVADVTIFYSKDESLVDKVISWLVSPLGKDRGKRGESARGSASAWKGKPFHISEKKVSDTMRSGLA